MSTSITALDSSNKTTVVPMTIVCPPWCVIPPQEHINELWNMAGCCIHWTTEVEVKDRTGFQEALEPTRFNTPVTVWMTSQTNPEGRETASPVVNIHEREHTIQQALDLAEEIRRQVEVYRSAGGGE